jgi:hypothetical protein
MSVTPGPTTGFTIGTAQFPTLTAQPFAYDETDVRAGLTARKWILEGLLKPSEWVALLGVYDGWRNTRIQDADTAVSGVVGTTIALSGKGAGSQTWTSVACWFASAPSGEQTGRYIAATVELVDANEALAVILRQKEAEEESSDEDLPDLGTYVIGDTTLTLLKPVDTYAGGPSLSLTATGVHYVEGPLVFQRVKDVEGTTNVTGWNSIRSWYETQVGTTPSVGALFPISPPTASARNKIVSGVKTVEYTVSIQLGQVL